MNREDSIRMAREAASEDGSDKHKDGVCLQQSEPIP
jgi:hypothetical protein